MAKKAKARTDVVSLKRFDTPTISNALNIVLQGAQQNFTRGHFLCAFPALEPMIGFAKTATMRGVRPSPLPFPEEIDNEIAYWAYVQEPPQPSIAVIQDLDGPDLGYACICGEVNATIMKGLGCVGAILNGSVRDLDLIPKNFQIISGSVTPFGSWSHFVDFNKSVNVFGMCVNSHDLIHADRHGALVIPADSVSEVIRAAELDMRRERPLIEAGKSKSLTIKSLRTAYKKSAQAT